MGRREQARAESAFLRGQTGVDGQATQEDTRDAAQVEQDKAREQFVRGGTWLGREFLTWLLWRSEPGDALLQHEGEDVVVLFNGRTVLRGIHGDVTELQVKGTMAPYSEHVRRALDSGLLIHAARVLITVGERSWEASLDAEYLDIRSAKLPALLTEEEDDRISERLDLAEQLSTMITGLVKAFQEERTSKAWSKKIVPEMKAWMRGEEGSRGSTVSERARRAAG